MPSTTTVRIVVCPNCHTHLLAAYRCANCDAILEVNDEDSSPTSFYRKSSKDSKIAPATNWRDAPSLRSVASVSGSEHGLDETEYEEADDNIKPRELSMRSSSRREYDDASSKSFGEPSELGIDSDWIYEGEDTLSQISSIALEEDGEPWSVNKDRNLRCSNTSERDNLWGYEKQYDDWYEKFSIRKTNTSIVPVTKVRTSNGRGLLSTGSEYKNMVNGQRLSIPSRRTFDRQGQLPSQKNDVNNTPIVSMGDHSMPIRFATSVKTSVSSETIMNEEEMSSFRLRYGDWRSSPMMPVEVKQNPSVNAVPTSHEDPEEHEYQRVSERRNYLKFGLDAPTSSVGLCASIRNPPRRVGLVQSTQGHIERSPVTIEGGEREIVIGKLDELKGYLTRIPASASVDQFRDADSSNPCYQSGSSHSINKNSCGSCSSDEDDLELSKQTFGLHAPQRSDPEPFDSSQRSNLQIPRTPCSPFDPYVGSNFESDRETVTSVSVENPLHYSHDYYDNPSHSMPKEIESDKRRNLSVCSPILGGAPFFICLNCSMFFKLHTRFLFSRGRVNKVRCGNCTEIIKFDVSDNGCIRIQKQNLLPAETHKNSEYNGSKVLTTRDQDGGSTRDAMSVMNGDFQSESASFSEEYGASFSRSDRSSSSGSYSLKDPSSSLRANISERRDSVTGWDEEGSKRSGLSAITSNPGSLLRSNLHCRSESEHLERNQSGNSQSGNGGIGKINSSESANRIYQGPQPKKWSKAANISGFVKKGVANIGLHISKRGVAVNGRCIPDRLVKKAEERAGHIDPGHYWYDYHAGFWGVMGNSCHGIIPPYIEEFNIPMPRDCSGGTTGVIVNGRELHQEDLDMLAAKGLPASENREYVINISGRVIDIATRQRFNLGNLAPTVEMTGRGFGMLIPRSLD